ncbi:ComEA family DNA-binding protein [Caryophanon latum]|uniref:Helix-hairpin-helix DNA-binding motif class 1 domain-containing protein n=1 Tax=Caryophanon latum TaxID=33977 RepID=A0A1C0Z523_9BACL|nr:ComEA family DNA-binding protein [Caryophanon latum]OCS94619.1 hypothetical protein A6K76_00160 [Caryophanon latum]
MQQWMKYAAIPAAALLLFLIFFFTGRSEPTDTTLPLQQAEQQPIEQDVQEEVPQPASIVVDVKGAVRSPGVYTLTDEQRVIDAINAAGGYVDGADSTLINHAEKLTDALVIYVPLEGEEMPVIASAATFTSSASSNATSSLININTASDSDLQTLPGIGPSKAQAIIRHREENGAFTSPEQLTDVTGIGDKTFEQLADLITVK